MAVSGPTLSRSGEAATTSLVNSARVTARPSIRSPFSLPVMMSRAESTWAASASVGAWAARAAGSRDRTRTAQSRALATRFFIFFAPSVK